MSRHYLTLRCVAWVSSRGYRTERLAVEPDGTVLVYDPIAGHYTHCHALSMSATMRARLSAIRAARRASVAP